MSWLHKLTTMLTQNYSLIGIEGLNIKGMVKNHNLARSIHDQSWHELSRQLAYKAEITGTYMHYSNSFFASSQLCSKCGYKNTEVKKLSVRQWFCLTCGTFHDRDANAAENLKQDAIRAVISKT